MKLEKHLAILSAAVLAVSASGGSFSAGAVTLQSFSSGLAINLTANAEPLAIAAPKAVQLYETGSTESGWQYSASDTDVAITGYTGSETSLTVPDTIDGKPVTTISDGAFKGTKLESVTIPDSVTVIGREAFADCQKLKEISLGNSLKTIGNHVFSNCPLLKEITIPKTVTKVEDYGYGRGALANSSIEKVTFEEGILNIPARICKDASALTTVVMPEMPEDELTYAIGASAFEGTALTSIEIPKTVTGIYDSAFKRTKLASVTIPDSVITIDREVFADCPKLKEVSLGNGLKTIGNHVFSNCPLLKEITIPKSVTKVEHYGYNRGALANSSIEKVTFEDGIKNIPAYICKDASALTTVVIPEMPEDELTYVIGASAFEGTALKEVDIPASVTGIGEDAFAKCSKLTDIKILNPDCKITDSDKTIFTATLDKQNIFRGTIYGYADSTAQAYAEKYNRTFVALPDPPPVKDEVLRGDVNLDQAVSVEDVQTALKAYTVRVSGKDHGLTAKQVKAADVNEDGELSVDDVQNILIYYVNNTVAGKVLTWDDILGKKAQAQPRPELLTMHEDIWSDADRHLTEAETS